MARLTILQASQQGFGSTLTIHRHIKDGTLPVYEDGDTKLLDVDDLIAVFGEPSIAVSDTVAPAANGQVDIHEFNRIKAELDQKNKKNMWLAADLAEVVRELKEKEASFEQERNRLLTVLEQAQALLLREAGKDGKLKAAAEKAGTTTLSSEEPPPVSEPPETDEIPEDSSADVSIEFGADIDTGEQRKPDPISVGVTEPAEQTLDDLLPKLGITPPNKSADDAIEIKNESATFATSADSSLDMPERAADDIVPDAPSTDEATPDINPMMPPLEDPDTMPRKNRSVSTTTWIMLIAMIGGGFLLFEYRTNVIAGLNKLGKLVSGF